MTVYTSGGKVVLVGGEVAVDPSCCCDGVCMQLGTDWTFTAPYNCTTRLFFNDSVGYFGDNHGSYTVAFSTGGTFTVDATLEGGVAGPTLTAGTTYHVIATGRCYFAYTSSPGCAFDADGGSSPSPIDSCPGPVGVPAVCPTLAYCSLVMKLFPS